MDRDRGEGRDGNGGPATGTEDGSVEETPQSAAAGDAVPRVLHSFVDAIPTPTLACDPETHAIRAANAPAADLLGRDRGTLTLMGLSDLGEGVATVDGDPIDAAGGGDPIDAAVDAASDADGVARVEWSVGAAPRRRLELACHETTIAERTWLIAGLTDVTDRVTAEEGLRSQLRVVDAIAATIPAALFQCTAGGTLSRWNDRLTADTGYGDEELSETALTSLFDEESRDAVAETLRSVYRRGTGAECEATLLTRSGERVPYRLSLGPVTDGDEVVGAVGVGEDVTDASLREERLAVLTRVLRHNFRNDLNVVTGFTERAAAEVEDPAVVAELERVVDTAERLLRVGETSRRVERLLADRPTPRPTDLAGAVGEALASLPPELRERADVEVDVPDGITVSAIGYLAEAIAELVDNAIRHNDADRPAVSVTAAELPSESWTSLVIADDGQGIPPAERAVLTGEETPLEHASGLGLWYVNWIVTAAGGGFDIGESKAGGTRIEIELRTADGE
ncbi:PAS domain-containing sensor histidine kinase [Halorubrum sp. AD140]|uniref:PAS domain-containing sensor histidine kinase n=1 Tax=Halorubrum sp. AD140 TaxID=3050073 RepID=UPI002ACCC016|nr:PAS domain-containing sensor histidine kinase [Halorubrum sp. AD140]MDZ5811174.1 PAS domain-containing sensor histidine kinase [Halorubrum sp. AD140]